jgi:DNA modification methylase
MTVPISIEGQGILLSPEYTDTVSSAIDAEYPEYMEFLREKIGFAPSMGFPCDESEVNPILLPHQRACVAWAVEGGRRALFESFGLGKTVQQLEVVRLVLKKAKAAGKSKTGRGLIVLPLGVRQEFVRDAAMLGIPVRFVRWSHEVDEAGIYLTNYESIRDGRLEPNLFDVVSLDEASALRSYGSKTYQTFLSLFEQVLWKFVATATPSPNRFKELIHYAGFLGIMDTGQALTRFFQRDSTKANNLTLYPHKEREFWLWLNSWAIFLQRPSDLGFSDAGYDLPPLTLIYHELSASRDYGNLETNGQATMMLDAAVGLRDAAAEKRGSLQDRIQQMLAIVNAAPPDTHFLIWHTLEDERHAIEAVLPDAVTIYGTQDEDEKEEAIIGFSEGRIRILAGKPSMIGSGCNFQRHCYTNILLGIDYKANDLLQLVHRTHRYQQEHEVYLHVIHTETEREILKTLLHKWEQHKAMTDTMSQIIREHGLNSLSLKDILQRTIGVERIEVKGLNFALANNDAVLEARRQAENSVELIVTSIPFSNHYEYTPCYEDFGHTDGNSHFWKQMDFLSPELFRMLEPGRLLCCHVKDRHLYGNVTGLGFHTCAPFHAEAIFHYMKHGFLYMGMITVVTDVVRENNQTYRLSWTENGKDGTKMGVGSPEYILLFRKPQSDQSKGYADVPVVKAKKKWDKQEGDWENPDGYSRSRWQVDAHAFWRSSGNRLLTAEEMAGYGTDKLVKMFTAYSLQNVYDYEFHVRIGDALDAKGALPASFMSLAPGSHSPAVWHDVNRMLTLNGEQASKGREMHVCPLQFDIVNRLIERYSMPGELVYDPFMGIGTVGVCAVKLGRRGQGSELNSAYFFDSVHYLKAAEDEMSMPSLFALEEAETEPAEREEAAA